MRYLRRYIARFAERLSICERTCASFVHGNISIRHRGNVCVLFAMLYPEYFISSRCRDTYMIFNQVADSICLYIKASSKNRIPAGVKSLKCHVDYFINERIDVGAYADN